MSLSTSYSNLDDPNNHAVSLSRKGFTAVKPENAVQQVLLKARITV
ncbi:Conserved hypothetical protein [Prochlorococcus marinus str. MIT 9303]|uniref:Uncharacterized protein n=1 Tax=Prochlorococcus marinus (strain MIT 9303) TaxID=59922 RepID=A2CBT9_PROM3|nr:Conserved hypothetical protein [Prochlorococcus marinus str. MIT 9303]